MNPRNSTVLCVAVFLIVVVSASPCFAQYYAYFPTGSAFRFSFMSPAEVDAGMEFVVIVFAEHVSGTRAGTPLFRVTATPSPIIIPIQPTSGEMPMFCDPNWCWLPGPLTGIDQESAKMRFMVDPTAAPGSVLILKVDVSDLGVGWTNEPDIRVRVKCPAGQHWDATANACVLDTHTCPAGQHWDPATNTCVVTPPQCTAPCTRLDPNTNTCVSTCSPGQQCENNQCMAPCPLGTQRNPQTNSCDCPSGQRWNPDKNSCENLFDWTWVYLGVVAVIIVIGIAAVFLLTRKKPAPSAGYKPYYPTAPAAPMLKPGAPQAVKPAAHRPMVIARREEEKK